MPHLEFSELTLLLAQALAILMVSRLFAFVLHKLGQPSVIAEVLGGIALGPSLLGWLAPEVMSNLFPTRSLPILKLLGHVGLILFMFLIGLEFDLRLLQKRARAFVFISYASILFPFALGAAMATQLWPGYSALPSASSTVSSSASFAAFVLFLGVGMSVTAFPVLASILSERRLLRSRVGGLALACAAVDDVTAWCLLAFTVAVARARGFKDGIWTSGLALAFVLVLLGVLRPLLQRYLERSSRKPVLTPNVQAVVLMLLIASSGVAELIGIHAVIGAFLFGVIVPKTFARVLREKLESVAVVLLLPLFFAYSGLRTQIGLLDRPEHWLIAGVLILIATLGKFGGGAVAARLSGLGWQEAGAVGILMNTRGLMELVVLNIGRDLGIISPLLFTMMILMALVTTIATAPVLRWVYPDRQWLAESTSGSESERLVHAR
jgi:Kef-type K+ transport system membrane component KefB